MPVWYIWKKTVSMATRGLAGMTPHGTRPPRARTARPQRVILSRMLFLPSLKRGGRLASVGPTLVFIGSRKLKQLGETYDPWTSTFAPNLKIYGIDADATACELMNAENAANGIGWFEKHTS